MLIEGFVLGSKRVYTENPDSLEYNTAYRGSEFRGNSIFTTEDIGIIVNGDEKLQADTGSIFYISNNYYYQFDKETLVGEVIAVSPDLGLTESTISDTSVTVTANTETGAIITHTMSTGIGELPVGGGYIELSFVLENTDNQNGVGTVRIYDDGTEYASIPVSVNSNSTINFFTNQPISQTIAAESVLTATVELSKDGNVLAPIELLIRKGN